MDARILPFINIINSRILYITVDGIVAYFYNKQSNSLKLKFTRILWDAVFKYVHCVSGFFLLVHPIYQMIHT